MSHKSNPEFVFIAEGIGITPFRSMITYILDKKQNKHIVLFYRVNRADRFIFRELFEEAKKFTDLKVIYILNKAEENWTGETGSIDGSIVKKYIQHPQAPVYYLSGPQKMVETYRIMLNEIGVPSKNIKTDLFTGYENP